MLTYYIIALDGGAMVPISEETLEKAWPDSSMPSTVRAAIETTLDYMSEKKEENKGSTCSMTGLPCIDGCDQKTCAGMHIPLNEWPK